MPKTNERGDAYKAVSFIYEKSPGRSWQRLNGALHGVLIDSITAMLSFKEDDFKAICDNMRGGYWMGDGAGSHLGERYYNHAVDIGHTPACISFEKWAGRPAALWPEKTKTPERLHVGAKFTWEGLTVTVTSMKKEHLVACTYKDCDSRYDDSDRLEVDNLIYAGRSKCRAITEVRNLENGDTILRLGEIRKERERQVDRRFTIKYEELTSRRKEYDARRKVAVKSITDAETVEALEVVIEAVSRSHTPETFKTLYRHFDIEQIQEAIQNKRKSFKDAEVQRAQALSEAERLDKWLAGEAVSPYFSQTKLRIRGTYVEVSNGQKASVESVRKALPIVMKRRKKMGPMDGVDVDFHPVRQLTKDGVQVGCTLVPWPEVERLEQMMLAQELDETKEKR